MATVTKTVPKSEKTDREEVVIELKAVDRKRRRVKFEIPKYNAFFIFTEIDGSRIFIFNDDRDRGSIKPGLEAVIHVSHSVYSEMAGWAGSILHSKRPKK